MKRVWVTDTNKLSHRQKGLINTAGQLSRFSEDGWGTNINRWENGHQVACSWRRSGCSLYDLIQTNIVSRQFNNLQKCLTVIGIFCGGMKNKHLSSVEKKSPNCLQLKDLATTCMSPFKQTEHHQSSINTIQKCLTAFGIFLLRDEEQTPLICRENVTEIACSWWPGNVDDWDLHSTPRNQQVTEHDSRLNKMSMNETWVCSWEISNFLKTTQISKFCW